MPDSNFASLVRVPVAKSEKCQRIDTHFHHGQVEIIKSTEAVVQ